MLFVAFILAGAISAALVPAIIAFAEKMSLYDGQGGRKIHTGEIPRLGGVAIFLAFFATIGAFAILEIKFRANLQADLRYWPVFGGVLTIFCLGLVDDLKSLRARFKLAIQLAAALLIVGMGYRFRIIAVPFGDYKLHLGILSVPVTMIWIIGITNAMNLIDGLDGLSGGITSIAAASFGLFCLVKHDTPSAVICFALSGAVGGFLLYNLPKAKIFMGDSGALFIGFSLSVLPLLNQTTDFVEIGLISAIMILIVPILDTLSAMYRRIRAGVSIMTADRGHIHHMLLDLGLSTWQILAVIYSLCLFMAFFSLSAFFLPFALSFIIKLSLLPFMTLLYALLVRKTRDLAALKSLAQSRKKID